MDAGNPRIADLTMSTKRATLSESGQDPLSLSQKEEGASATRDSSLVCLPGEADQTGLVIVPAQTGWKTVRLSRSAVPPRPWRGNSVGKLPCSPCRAM